MKPVWSGLRSIARDSLPEKCQVPATFWYTKLRGGLEEELRFLKFLVRHHDRVIDVGGNRGVYVYQLWRMGATVEVFEPNPRCFGILAAWAADKRGVNVYSVALSNVSGAANLHIPIDKFGIEHDASASIENMGFTLVRDQLVQVKTLDSYRFQSVSLIKIDVEGHESSVIAGALETITSSQPALIVEIEQRHHSRSITEVFEKILGFGYQGYFVGPGGLVPLATFDAARHQSRENFGCPKRWSYISNFLFLHKMRLDEGEYDALISGELL